MRSPIGVIIEFAEVQKLIDRAGIALEIADKFLVLRPFWSARKPIS
jgi:hypothetical protein